MVLSWKIFQVLKNAVWFRVPIIGHTSESSVTYWLEVSVSPVWWVVSVRLLEVVASSKCFVLVVRIADSRKLVYAVVVHHFR